MSELNFPDQSVDFEKALELSPDGYQDIVIDGEVVREGERMCQKRGELMLSHISDGESILDVGSNYSYFGQKFLSNRRDCCYLGIEVRNASSVIGARVMRDFPGATVIHGNLDYELIKAMDESCERFDTILLLSVLHHYPLEQIVEICVMLDRMSRKVIIEVPPVDDLGACGQDVIHQLFGAFNSIGDALRVMFPRKRFELIGHEKSYVSEAARPIYAGVWKDGLDVYTKPAKNAFVGASPANQTYWVRPEHLLIEDASDSVPDWIDLKPGFSLWNWSKCGRIAAPDKATMLSQVREQMNGSGVRPWNLIRTSQGAGILEVPGGGEGPEDSAADDLLEWVESIYQ